MARFPGVDYMLVESQLSEQELLVQQTARQFVDDRVIPVVRDCFRDGRFPKELIPEMGRLGFFGANLEGYGCAGMSNVEYGLVMQEIELGDSGLDTRRRRAFALETDQPRGAALGQGRALATGGGRGGRFLDDGVPFAAIVAAPGPF